MILLLVITPNKLFRWRSQKRDFQYSNLLLSSLILNQTLIMLTAAKQKGYSLLKWVSAPCLAHRWRDYTRKRLGDRRMLSLLNCNGYWIARDKRDDRRVDFLHAFNHWFFIAIHTQHRILRNLVISVPVTWLSNIIALSLGLSIVYPSLIKRITRSRILQPEMQSRDIQEL